MGEERRYREVLVGTREIVRGVRKRERSQKEMRQRRMGEQGDTCWGTRGREERTESREDAGDEW